MVVVVASAYAHMDMLIQALVPMCPLEAGVVVVDGINTVGFMRRGRGRVGIVVSRAYVCVCVGPAVVMVPKGNEARGII